MPDCTRAHAGEEQVDDHDAEEAEKAVEKLRAVTIEVGQPEERVGSIKDTGDSSSLR